MLPQPCGKTGQNGRDKGTNWLQPPSRQVWWKPAIAVDNTRNRQFDVTAPDTVWGEAVNAKGSREPPNDITYMKTYEGFSYRAIVMDLFSRRGSQALALTA